MKELFFTTFLAVGLFSVTAHAYDDDTNDNIYEGSSGTKYKYDLSNPSDKIMYDVDVSAQLEDSINVNPSVQLDRGLGQYGGGIMDD